MCKIKLLLRCAEKTWTNTKMKSPYSSKVSYKQEKILNTMLINRLI